MSNRSDLRPLFKYMPKWMLLLVCVFIGFPCHFARGVFIGIRNWQAEVLEVWNLESDD